ncbi:competence protein CoiA family protein [Polluticaenibacter yanchengensis]|uniref:Competence protein n=1 Tax=Polluticaenibacter yanchengensis TaxID=3014562 RepID=A0ABT4UP01_9BACT|nr:hypothetical protein [Chitinophagaceae bacterium LY-5]
MFEYKLGKDRLTGKIISIDDVSRGISCNCICPDCELNFVAAKGEKNRWHFRHFEKTECNGGQETALHLLAKEIITVNNQIILPVYGKVSYTNAIKEQFFETIKPDVSAITNGQNLFFEVLVTHAAGDVKDGFYIAAKHKSVEINLKNYSFTNRENLENEILNNILNKRIIFWEEKVSNENVNKKSLIFYFLTGVSILLGVILVLKFVIQNKLYRKSN